jgi:fructose-1,6-bisphosphatase/inositol monophosphatase family enzyme
MLTNHHLSLPQAQQVKTPPYSIPVSPEFEKIWTEGPLSDTQTELARCIRILGLTFGKLAKRCQPHVIVKTKTHDHDHVTNADIGIEILIRDWIGKWYPTHKIIGEEGLKPPITPQDIVWYIDPIDGTTNYLNQQSVVAMHIGCIKDGKPYVSFVGCPILDTYYWTDGQTVYHEHAPLKPNQHSKTLPFTISTEFLHNRVFEAEAFTYITEKNHANTYRAKSIGYSLMQYLIGNVMLFYKPSIKLWDVIAPICLIKILYPNVTTELTIAGTRDPLCKENAVTYDALSNDPLLIDHLNHRHKTSCRAGFVAVYKDTLKPIRDDIFNTLYPLPKSVYEDA